MKEDGIWIKRTTIADVASATSSVGCVGDIEQNWGVLPHLTADQIVDQFGAVHSGYEFSLREGTTPPLIIGATDDFHHTVFTHDVVGGLYEIKRRLDWDVGQS